MLNKMSLGRQADSKQTISFFHLLVKVMRIRTYFGL